MMAPQKVVLAGTEEDPDAEVELGPFTQGIMYDALITDAFIDLASSEIIVRWRVENAKNCGGWIFEGVGYDRVFIQTYAPNPASDGLVVSARDRTYSDVHEDGRHVLYAKHAEATLYVAARRTGRDHEAAAGVVWHLWREAMA